MNKDLWAILVDKAKGGAWNKLTSAGDGEGMWGYVRIHQWFSKTTQQGKVVNRAKAIQPEPPKNEWEVAGAIQKWEERYRQMVEEQGEEELLEVYKMAALRQLLVGDINKHVELREDELKVYTDLRQCVMKWALMKRTEKERKNKDDTDVSPADEEANAQGGGWDEWGSRCGGWNGGLSMGNWQEELNWMGKGGKGDAKGKRKRQGICRVLLQLCRIWTFS